LISSSSSSFCIYFVSFLKILSRLNTEKKN
jgi:hypothetical protein